MSLPFGGTMRHAHCADTESNSAIQHRHSVTSFLEIEEWSGKTEKEIGPGKLIRDPMYADRQVVKLLENRHAKLPQNRFVTRWFK